MDEVHHSVDLDLTYQIADSPEGMVFVFEDGVVYTLPEALMVAGEGFTKTDVVALHRIKKTLDGELQPGVRLLGIVVPDVPLQRPKLLKRVKDPSPAFTIKNSGSEQLKLQLGRGYDS